METEELIKSAVQKLKKAHVDEAISELQRAVEQDADNFQAHNYLGIAYSQKGMQDFAIAELRKACELNPMSPLPCYNLGMAYLEIGHTAVAKSCFARALLIDPDYERARMALERLEPPAATGAVGPAAAGIS